MLVCDQGTVHEVQDNEQSASSRRNLWTDSRLERVHEQTLGFVQIWSSAPVCDQGTSRWSSWIDSPLHIKFINRLLDADKVHEQTLSFRWHPMRCDDEMLSDYFRNVRERTKGVHPCHLKSLILKPFILKPPILKSSFHNKKRWEEEGTRLRFPEEVVVWGLSTEVSGRGGWRKALDWGF